MLFFEQADFVKARSYFGQAIAINKKANRDEHPTTATILNNLGLVTQKQGFSKELSLTMSRAEDSETRIRERKFGGGSIAE